MNITSKIIFLLALSCAGLSQTARAQMSDPLTGSSVDYGTWSNSNAMMNMMNNNFTVFDTGALKKASVPPAVASQRARGKQVIASGKASTSFTNSGAFILPQRLGAQLKQTPADIKEVEKAMRAVSDAVTKELKTQKLAANDLAVAFAALTDVARQLNGAPELNASQINSLTEQFKSRLNANEFLQGMTNADKQFVYEKTLFVTGFYVARFQEESVKKNAEALQKIGEDIAAKYESFAGFPLSAINVDGEEIEIVENP